MSKLHDIIEKGAHVLGTTAGTALSVVAGSPEVGIAVAAIGATGVYQKVGSEVADRWLAPREQARVGGVLALSAEMLKSQIDLGGTLRDDGFFDTPPDGRSDAEEIMESVLRKAQTEYEERKLPYIARLWSNACLDEKLSPGRLNSMAKLAEQLTYRQFTIISIVGAMTKADWANIYGLREADYESTNLSQADETATVLTEIIALHNLSCVKVIAPLGFVQVTPSELKLDVWGVALYNSMGLGSITRNDPRQTQEVVNLLK